MIRIEDIQSDGELVLEVTGVEVSTDLLGDVRERRLDATVRTRVEAWMRRNMVEAMREMATIEDIQSIPGGSPVTSNFFVTVNIQA